MKLNKKIQKPILISVGALVILSVIIFLLPTINKSTQINVPILSYPLPEYTQPVIPSSDFKMLFVGDVMLSRSIGDSILNGDNPFKNIKDKFKEYGVIVANLETVASEDKYAVQNATKLYTFNSPVSALDKLTENGISVVSLANNHTMDYGANALLNTIDNLKSRGILAVGAGSNTKEAFAPKYIYYQKTRIAIIAVNDIETWVTNVSENSPGSAYFDKDLIKNSIAEAKQNADIVIVFPHWGIEYSLTNSDRQSEYAHFFIDSGADVVIGSHPHVLENSEEYNGKQIFYSMGNFVFDDMCTIPNACNAGMVELNISENKIKDANLIKVKLADNGYPELE